MRPSSRALAVLFALILPSLASAQAATQRGDVAFGYSFMQGNNISFPAGFNFSNATRFGSKTDFVFELQANHGTTLGVGANVFGVMVGVRGSGGSNYGEGVRQIGDVLIGLTSLKVSYGVRSEERRVGKECRSRWSPYH